MQASERVLIETQPPRRRNKASSSSTWSFYENSSLEVEGNSVSGSQVSSYSTFGKSPCAGRSRDKDELPCWWTMVSQILVGRTRRHSPSSFVKQKSFFHHGFGRHLLTILVALGLCIITMVFRLRDTSPLTSSHVVSDSGPVWEWYHYHYVPKPTYNGDNGLDSHTSTMGIRNLLVAQMSGPGALGDIAEITSRPNRAYSKQWGVDFLRYSGRQGLSRECFNKLVVLDTLLKRQERSKEPNSKGHAFSSNPREPKRTYDAILFLPADSIITDLDYDLLSLLPQDKLVAIAGSTPPDLDAAQEFTTGESGIVMWNLNHPHATTASKLWMDFVQHPQFNCQGANDMGFLLMAIESLAINNGDEELTDLVQHLEETKNGFVSPRVIKFVPAISSSEPRINTLVKNIYETTAKLESDSDSVCYRYYPRCEVL